MIRGASVIGREHVRLAKNNQDAWASAEHRGSQVVVVCDGCSSEKSSEVGAQLGARWLANWVAGAVGTGEGARIDEPLALRATGAMAEWVRRVAKSFEGDFDQAVSQYLLFTFLCAVTHQGRSLVFGVGDGVILIDDQLIGLDSGPENAPNYLAYRVLWGRGASRVATLAPQVHFVGEARSRLVVMTDGFESVAEKVPELVSKVSANPLGLQRKLNVFSEVERLNDDATVAALFLEA